MSETYVIDHEQKIKNEDVKNKRRECSKSLQNTLISNLLHLLIFQIMLMSAVLILVGAKILTFTDLQFTTLFLSVFGEIAVISIFMIRYAFSRDGPLKR